MLAQLCPATRLYLLTTHQLAGPGLLAVSTLKIVTFDRTSDLQPHHHNHHHHCLWCVLFEACISLLRTASPLPRFAPTQTQPLRNPSLLVISTYTTPILRYECPAATRGAAESRRSTSYPAPTTSKPCLDRRAMGHLCRHRRHRGPFVHARKWQQAAAVPITRRRVCHRERQRAAHSWRSVR